MSTVPEGAPTSAVRSRDVEAGGYAVRLHESGTPGAPVILFLHGSGPGATGLSNWERVIADLGEEYHCLAPDMVGFGDSAHPVDAPRGMGPFNELRAAVMMALLDDLGVDQVHLVGNSMGGQLALLIALAQPQRVATMLLMGSGGAPDMPVPPGLAHLRTFYADPTEESLRGLLTEFVADLEPLRGKIDEVVAARMSYVRREDVQRSHEASFDPNGPRRFFTPEELATLEHPVLVVHGREDRIIPVEASHYFAEHLPNANLYVIGNCGHWTQIEHHRTFVTLLRRLVEGVA